MSHEKGGVGLLKFHAVSVKDSLKELNSSLEGLSSEEGRMRLAQYGPNLIKGKKKQSPIALFLSQFNDFIIWILLIAAAISFLIDERLDAAVILIIVIINAMLGFIQTYRAEKSIEALKKLTGLKAKILRDKKRLVVSAEELVPGDIIFLETGEKVPADCRLIEAATLEVLESQLTGESMPVRKQTELIKEAIVSDQSNMVFSGTIITKGRGRALVTATGMATELGKIAEMIEEAHDEETPLQKNLESLGRFIGFGVLAVCAFIFVTGLVLGKGALEMFLSSVSLAVAAVPEGLPAIVTICLALGVQRMVKRNALIRKLPSVETLGCTTVICTDKTGTLTKDEMTVVKGYTSSGEFELSGEGYDANGSFSRKVNGEVELMLRIGALCNDALFEQGNPIGDPTELALIVSARKGGLAKETLEKEYLRIDEMPFESERKLMSTVHKSGSESTMFTKGAPDILLKQCKKYFDKGRVKSLTDSKRKEILKKNEKFAGQALRVLGFSYKPILKKGDEKNEENLIFVGLQAMMDPPRDGVKEAIEECSRAGIRVVMITGDHKLTAVAIAEKLGLRGKALTGEELESIPDLEKIVNEVTIYARVLPEHKVKIVDAWQKLGHVVAMTGDGINDAPALKKSDIGIAMGLTGTDVAKEASDMILTDDRFTSIVNAVEEGRGIYDNIRKFVLYLLSSNIGEVLTIFMAIILGMQSLPLIAIQILWVNLVTDGLPALALGIEPMDKEIMLRKPRKKSARILDGQMLVQMIFVGIIMAAGTLAVFVWAQPAKNLPYARTMAFTTIVMFEMFNVLNCKSQDKSVFSSNIFSNIYLILAVITSIGLQVLVVYFLGNYFKTVPLGLLDWVIAVAVASTAIFAVELIKLIQRHMQLRNKA